MRPEKLEEKIEEIIEEGQKPSVKLLCQEMGWLEQDVHRCLNSLEKKDRVQTYSKELMGRKMRLVSLKR